MPPKVKVQVKGNVKKYSEFLTEEFRLNNTDVKTSGSKIREIATEAMKLKVFDDNKGQIKATAAYDKLINATKNILRGNDQTDMYDAMKFFKDNGIAVSDGQRGTRWYILPPDANINDEDIVFHVGMLQSGMQPQGAQNPEHKDPNEGLSDDEKVVSEALAETGVTMAELQEANIQLAKDNKAINEKLVNMANAYEKQLRETNDRMDEMQSNYEKALQEAISKKEKVLEKARGLRDENDELRIRLQDIYDQNGQEDEDSDGSDGMQSAVSMEIEEEEEEQTDVWGRVSDIFGIRKAPKAPVLNKKEAEKDEDEELWNDIYEINREHREQSAGATHNPAEAAGTAHNPAQPLGATVTDLANAVPKPPLDANETQRRNALQASITARL